MIFDLEDLERGEVDQGMQALDRMGIIIVEREGAHPDEAVEDAPPAFDRVAEIADRPGVDAHVVELVDETAAPQGLLEARVRLHGPLDVEDLFDRHHGTRGLVETLGHHLAGLEVDPALPNPDVAAPEGVETRDPLEGRTGDRGADDILGGLVHVDRLDPEIVAPCVVIADDGGGTPDLGRAQRIERMAGHALGVGRPLGHMHVHRRSSWVKRSDFAASIPSRATKRPRFSTVRRRG